MRCPKRINHKYIPPILFLFGGICAILLSFKNNYWFITPSEYESLECFFLHVRLTYLGHVTEELQAEGIYKAFFWFFDHNSAYYLYLAYLTNTFNLVMGKAFIITQFAGILFLMSVFPTLIYKITDNVVLSLGSIALFFCMPHIAPCTMFQINDCYWAYYLVIAIGVPVLYILIRNAWSKEMWYYTFLLSFTIAVCNLVRSNAGIFLWLALIGIVIYKNWSPFKHYFKANKPKAIALILGIWVVFASPSLFTDTIPNLYLIVTNQDVSAKMDTMGPWHSLYIGLGWRENPDGLYYDDRCGYNQHPDTLIDAYLPQTPEYIEAIKQSYFETLSGHPFTYLVSYLLKAVYSLVMGIRVCLLVSPAFALFSSPVMAIVASGILIGLYLLATGYLLRRCYQQDGIAVFQKLLPLLFLFCIALLNGLLAPMVAMPTYVYITGVVGAYDIFIILVPCITLAHAISPCQKEIALRE